MINSEYNEDIIYLNQSMARTNDSMRSRPIPFGNRSIKVNSFEDQLIKDYTTKQKIMHPCMSQQSNKYIKTKFNTKNNKYYLINILV